MRSSGDPGRPGLSETSCGGLAGRLSFGSLPQPVSRSYRRSLRTSRCVVRGGVAPLWSCPRLLRVAIQTLVRTVFGLSLLCLFRICGLIRRCQFDLTL